MKKLLAHALVLSSFLIPTAHASACSHPFVDVIDHWAEDEICILYREGVIEGYSEKTFLPDSNVTRAEFLKMVLEYKGYAVYSVQSAAFTDTNPGDWYYQYVTFAHSKGFTSGYSDGSFHPNEPITRAEAVTLVMKEAGITAYDTSDIFHTFTDVHEDDWFAVSVAAATDLDIINGYGDGSFRPDNNITRAESAVVVEHAWESLR
jgi:hypothetical protein